MPTGLPYAPGSSQTKVIISLYLVVQDASPLLLKDCAPAADSAWLRRSLTFVGIVAQRNRQPRRGGTFTPSMEDASFIIFDVPCIAPTELQFALFSLSTKVSSLRDCPHAPGSSPTKVIINLHLVVQNASPSVPVRFPHAADSAWIRRSLTFVATTEKMHRQPRRGGTFIPSIQDASFMIIQVAWCRPYRASVPVVVLSYKDFVPTGLPQAPGSFPTKGNHHSPLGVQMLLLCCLKIVPLRPIAPGSVGASPL
ncbi:MAG TPA: hypothetical protein VKZ51_02580 [Cyclobacteriaceae bacterium]|nr:hypothetical protein [Cyclobacteriaceae bacterium]